MNDRLQIELARHAALAAAIADGRITPLGAESYDPSQPRDEAGKWTGATAKVAKPAKTDMMGRTVNVRGVPHRVVGVISEERFDHGFDFGAKTETGYLYNLELRPMSPAEVGAANTAKKIAETEKMLSQYEHEPSDFRDRDMYARRRAALKTELAALRT